MLAVVPNIPIAIRVANAGDLAFVDSLQKEHVKAVGFMRRTALEEKIAKGHVLVAWASRPCPAARNMGEGSRAAGGDPMLREEAVGYCISTDRYFKRDDCGIVYAMNILPGQQRKLVGASLLKAVFDRAAYGCRLFCCWCAQDLEANRFWESMGFVPLAFRAGRVGKKVRTHIFWQRRIREGDTSTPYWFPAKTDGGALREDRLVLPIPPGVHWSDEMPVLLPMQSPALPAPSARVSRAKVKAVAPKPTLAPARLWFASSVKPAEKKAERPKRVKIKADPALIARARELRDRYLEQFNSGLILPNGKYEVARQLDGTIVDPAPLLIEQRAA